MTSTAALARAGVGVSVWSARRGSGPGLQHRGDGRRRAASRAWRTGAFVNGQISPALAQSP